MEVIVSKMRGEEVADDGMIKFCQLEELSLVHLPNLKSFCKSTSEAPPLFNHQVSFPALERLVISGLPVKNIWNGQVLQSTEGSERVSFSQLKKVRVYDCSNMVNVLPSNMLLRLQALEILNVSTCDSMTSLAEGLTLALKSNAMLPMLRTLNLRSLPKLIKTWLNDEEYCSLDISISPHLRSLAIHSCESLRHVFSPYAAKNIAQIEKLIIEDCEGMEVIVSEMRGEEVADDGMIKFCQLKELSLVHLPNLKSFCKSTSEAPPLFNHQVDFPKLETLSLGGNLQNILTCDVLLPGEGGQYNSSVFFDLEMLVLKNLSLLASLWTNNLHGIVGFRNLRFVKITNCPYMRNLFTYSQAMALECLEILSVISCEIMEEVVEENKLGKPKAASCIKFPKLKMLNLIDLRNLKSLCNSESYSFSFPSLRAVAMKGCPEIKALAYGQVSLPRKILALVRNNWVCFEDLNGYFREQVPADSTSSDKDSVESYKNLAGNPQDDLRVFYDHDEVRFKETAQSASYFALYFGYDS